MNVEDEYDDEGEKRTRRGPKHAAKVPDETGEAILQRMAAMQVRRLTDQHHCTARDSGTCADPNHRRDMDYLGHMLDMVGLGRDYPSYTPAERRTMLRWIGQSGPADEQAA
jgi:hypothetical protein